MSAKKVAASINKVVTAIVAGKLSLEDGEEICESLWGMARKVGIAKEVDHILQEDSLREMSESMVRMGIPVAKTKEKP
jgi:hypothetical protein